jgi:hypothetical protein
LIAFSPAMSLLKALVVHAQRTAAMAIGHTLIEHLTGDDLLPVVQHVLTFYSRRLRLASVVIHLRVFHGSYT